jgi:hypothetical protein
MDRYGVRSKTAAVDLALRHLAGQPMTREEALAMRGAHAIVKLPADTPPHDATRRRVILLATLLAHDAGLHHVARVIEIELDPASLRA